MRLALYQPDIPQNVGSLIRLSACLGVGLEIIEPCGFALDDRKLKRAAMDYYEHASIRRHTSWQEFQRWQESSVPARRLVLLTTRGATPLHAFRFQPQDVLLLGRESCGAPDEVHEAADQRVVIPVQPPARSLNVAIAAAMALGEGLRQTGAWAQKAAS